MKSCPNCYKRHDDDVAACDCGYDFQPPPAQAPECLLSDKSSERVANERSPADQSLFDMNPHLIFLFNCFIFGVIMSALLFSPGTMQVWGLVIFIAMIVEFYFVCYWWLDKMGIGEFWRSYFVKALMFIIIILVVFLGSR